jgi:protein disulfide-isomerase A1
VTKFPTLQLFPAGAKDTPITYSGDRSLKDLMSFLRSNGVDRYNDTRESGSRVLDDTPVKDEL